MSEQRLIDADAFLELPEIVDTDIIATARVREDIANAPTVSVEVVVHCINCKYKAQAKANNKGFLICPASGMEITDNDFCSYGERRESEADQ